MPPLQTYSLYIACLHSEQLRDRGRVVGKLDWTDPALMG